MDCTIVDDKFPNEYQYQCKLVGSLLRAVPSVIVNHTNQRLNMQEWTTDRTTVNRVKPDVEVPY